MSEATAVIELGQIGKIPIKNILIKPRQRKEVKPENIQRLARSIENNGLLHPIVLNREDNSLASGFCRIQAHVFLGRDEIEFRYKDSMSELEQKVVELEENLARVNLEWWEEAAALAEIHALQKEIAEAKGETWNMHKTAEAVGKSAGTVSQAVTLSEEMKANPALKSEKGLVSALNKVKTKKQIEQRKKVVEMKARGLLKGYEAEVVVGDALELIRLEPDNEYDAIVTNFPFGIDYELKGGEKVYHDEEDYITELVMAVVKECFRILKSDSWMVAFFDMKKITYNSYQEKLYRAIQGQLSEENKNILEKSMGLAWWLRRAGFDWVSLVPASWVKPNKTQGIIGDPKKGTIVAYEQFLFAAKGNAILMKQGRNNVFIYDTPTPSERVHEMQMNPELCREIIQMITLSKAKVLDPFAGSASFGIGALDHQCSFKGFELDPERAARGNMMLGEHLMAKEKNDG